MSPDQRRTFRRLAHAYIARPDPAAWLLAADILEECGRDEEARLWRRRAEWYPAMRDAVQAQADYAATNNYRLFLQEVDAGPFVAVFSSDTPLCEWPPGHAAEIFHAIVRLRESVRLVGLGGRPIHWPKPLMVPFYPFICNPADGDRYYNRRTLELVDRLVEAEGDLADMLSAGESPTLTGQQQ